jgi:single-stranded-DNA-specific exonuclease
MEPLSFTGARWERLPVDPAALRSLTGRGLSEVAARCMAIRWGDQAAAIADLPEPELDALHDPLGMLGMEAAVERLRRAARDRQRVRVVTDYDVDGTTSSLILQAALRLIGPELRLDYHIPHRLTEGYGFSVAAAEQAAADGVDLIVTADIGVRDHAAVSAARAAGLDVLVCDHHLPAGESVPADAIVLCPPQTGDTYPNPSLAACGVSLKVAQALLADHPRRDDVLRSLLKLAAIGTVADMVPLTTPENRAIVTLGLRELNAGRHSPGLQALLDVADLKERIGVSDLGFRIGPRINAAGRVADANLVVELLTTRDPAHAAALARRLDALNRERRGIQDELVDKALAAVGADPPAFVVVDGPEDEGWHRGVVGIVAARLKERLHRSAAVVSVQGEVAVGSVRTTSGVHAVDALTACGDLLIKFGGHPRAAGFSVPTRHLDALRARLAAFVSEHAADALVPRRSVDAELGPEALDNALFEALRRLEPFGQGNPEPRLAVRGVRAQEVSLLGAAQRMVKLRVPRPGQDPIEAIWWDQAEHADALRAGPVDLLGTLSENVWKGRRTLQLRLSDARAAYSR